MHRLKLFGPPGTGKTSALLRELERELSAGVPPEKIAFMTFTVAARREAVARVTQAFGFKRARLPHFRTIHSAAFRQMGVPRSAIVTPDKIAHFAEVSNIEFSSRAAGNVEHDTPITSMMSSSVEGDRMMAFDHLRRHRMETFEQALIHWPERPLHLEHFTRTYARWKEREGLYDFTDLLLHATDPLGVEVVFIDEAQDLSKLQWAAVWRLCVSAERMYIAGDDDQAIFEWAGAEPTVFMDLEADESRVLGQSYRVPVVVHTIAERVSSYIRHRKDKRWLPRDEVGSVAWATAIDWWTPNDDGTTFILARNKQFLPKYEALLRELGVPYKRSDGDEDAGHKWADSVVAWEARRRGKPIDSAGKNAIERAVMPGAAIEPAIPWFEALTRVPESDRLFMRAVLRRYGNDGLLRPPRVTLSTIHAVKGREADHVVLDTGMSPVCLRKLHDEDPDSEARVTYVGVTRARQSFTLVGDHHPLIPVDMLGKEKTA